MDKKLIVLLLVVLVIGILVVGVLVYGNQTPTPESAVRPQSHDINIYSNMFTQYMPPLPQVVSPNPSLDGFVLAGETPYLRLYAHPVSLAIKVQNLTTGYIFSSTLDDMEAHRLNNIWRNRVDSAVTIDFANVGGTTGWESMTINDATVDFSLIDNGFEGQIVFGLSGIGLTLRVQLQDNDLVVQVPQAYITQPTDIQLMELHVYPFFGAVKEGEVPGYMFIPDGSGALIRYGDPGGVMAFPWRGAVYGNNLGLGQGDISTVNPPFTVAMPIWGKVHGQDAFLAIIESGDNYAELFAYTAGLITEFNWMYARFHYRYTYTRPTTRNEDRGPGVQQRQYDMNQFDIALRFRFLHGEDANYVGLAHAYQDFLLSRGMLSPMSAPAPAMRLEFLGGEVAEGLIFQQYLAMTPIENIAGYIQDLAAQGVENVLAVYRSFARGGSESFPNRFPIDRRLGNRGAVNNTVDTLAGLGVPLFFHTDYSRAYVSGGLFGRSDLALGINGRLFTGADHFYMSPTVALAQAREDANRFNALGIQHIALETTATSLHSVFNGGAHFTRQEHRAFLDELATVLNPNGQGQLALYQPNAYAWALTDMYLNVPMGSSGHLFVTDTVPFLHIVLRGHVAYYGPFVNFSANWTRDLLRHVEFGVYPSFLLTSLPAHLLAETASQDVFSSQFGAWEQLVVYYYQLVVGALSQVAGQPIIAREVLAPGVVAVTYSSGTQIVVNYTGESFDFNGATVPPRDFVVKEGM